MPAPGGQTDQQLLDQIKAVLSIDTLDAKSVWPVIARRANATAYQMCVQALLNRHYSVAQIDGSDQLATLQADLAVWVAVVKGGLTKDYDTKMLALFDRRDELKSVVLTSGGALVVPATPATSAGTIADDKDALFTLADEDMQDWYEVGEGPLVPPFPRR